MRNVDWIVIAPTVAFVALVAFALWVGLCGFKLCCGEFQTACVETAIMRRRRIIKRDVRKGPMLSKKGG